ncbi:MAG TPA: M48 family metalloprotease [Beijerinckiaceae bacterium]|jgi:predicted Zn-dependent protease
MTNARTTLLRRLAAAAALAALVAGCAADQTSALIQPAAPLPAGAPRIAGDERANEREHARLVAAFGGEYRAPEAQRLLAEVAARLVAATERPDEAYQITILDSPAVNAFALPSGRLYVTRGLLALANDISEVAAVLAHEIAHVTLRHAKARTELALQSALVSRVVSDVLNDPAAGATLLDQSRIRIAGFSRTQELEADQAGIRTLAKAGYDPHAAARFLNALGRTGALALAAADGSQKASTDMLSSHPGTPERIQLATQAARRIGTPGLADGDRARYLAAVDGLAYGDNPADGLIRGRRFVHPRLGVAFEAPEGIGLENTSKAVLGASPDGNRRLLFDAIEAAEGQSLESVLQSSWNESVETGSVESITLNGLPAAAAVAKGKDWTFRLAAVRVGSTTYRLVLASRGEPQALERGFRAALDSIRPVTAEEARGVRPLRVQLVTAGPDDTVESLSARMVVANRATERFLVLNGLERGARLKAGERYKVVAE